MIRSLRKIKSTTTLYKIIIVLVAAFNSCKSNEKKPAVTASKSIENSLNGKTEILDLMYIAWGCDCANWIKVEDAKRLEDQDSSLESSCIYLESAIDSNVIPAGFDPFKHILIVSGQFYKYKGLPPEMRNSEEHPERAPIFRYTSFKIIRKPD